MAKPNLQKYEDYLWELRDREEHIQSLLGFWLGVETCEEACDLVKLILTASAAAYDLIDQIAGAKRDGIMDLYTKEEIVELADKALVYMKAYQSSLPKDWQASEFKNKKS